MDDNTLLSDLCRICNSNVPKYCCPRCRCLTCSLPCYKRHKIWSQCSGKRDPSIYVKRSQLATPAGIDHDFNFLSKIERSMDQSDRNAKDCGISLEDFVVGRQRNSNTRLSRSFGATGVIIHRAPRGLSRQKQNTTQISRYNGRDCVSWTIEWILPDESKRLRNTDDYICFRDAYLKLCGSKGKTTGRNSKRKRALKTPEEPQEASITSAGDGLNFEKSDGAMPEPEGVNNADPSSTNHDGLSAGEEESDVYFYLHRPLTPGSTRVLIPLKSAQSVRASLQGRTVLEFPTVYVLHKPPHALPVGYQLERDFILQTRKTIQELEEELKPFLQESLSSTGQDALVEGDEDPSFDETKVMDSLQKDLAALSQPQDSEA